MEKIIIKNCNNIENGIITIKKDSLNLKYGINGTGKSTIAKAIQYTIDKDKNIEELKPFKYIGGDDGNPVVSGLEGFKKITIFNEEYVNEFTFKKDEILKDSFEIFIKDEKYKEGIKNINIFINDLKIYFEENSELELFISDLNNLVNYGKLSKNGKIGAAGILSKGLEKGNLIENIPSELSMYSDYLKNTERITWLGWQSTGEKFHNISSNKCPYCVSNIETKTETINKVSQIYDKKKIEHLNKVLEVINNLMKYFSEDTNEKIKAIISNTGELIEDQIEYLEKIILESKQIFDKLSNLKKLNFHDLKEIKKDEIESQISNLKIDLKYFPYFDSEHSNEQINLINSELDKLLDKITTLFGLIQQQKAKVGKTIEEYEKEINNFLLYAGYNYKINSIEEGDNYRLILEHNDKNNEVKHASKHLSYGEKNAFALVLFMFHSINQEADFIILDDPISSFDKNKKFAILKMLFQGYSGIEKGQAVKGKNLINKTVLMLTHDFEPIIDIIYNNLPVNLLKKADFIENINGNLTETEIKKDNIKNSINITEVNIENINSKINKLIFLRRLCEINNNKNLSYNVLSSLFHKKTIPTLREADSERSLSASELVESENYIKKYVPDFQYTVYLDKCKNDEYMLDLYNKSDSNYEKLQIYRIINEGNQHDSKIIMKFINESYHIENDHLFQLNPCDYNTIPQYIIDACDEDIGGENEGVMDTSSNS